MRSTKTPCYYCTDERHKGCHADCERWESFLEAEKKRKKVEYDSRNNESIYNRYSIEKFERLKKKKREGTL